MLPPHSKYCTVLVVAFLLTELVEGDALTMNTKIKDICSRSLSTLIFQICTGHLPVQDMPPESLSNYRGKRASLAFRERTKRQVADECCANPCTIAQLIEYCPDTW